MDVVNLPKTYKINEMFYSIQGEGIMAGKAAVFIRFSHCNLSCSWCDTEYDSGEQMTALEIADQAASLANLHQSSSEVLQPPIIVFTGGEPSLWLTQEVIDALKVQGFNVFSIETNGIKWNPVMAELDVITLSPKTRDGWWSMSLPVFQWRLQENVDIKKIVVKVVFDPDNAEFLAISRRALGLPISPDRRFMQPLEDQDTKQTNVEAVIPIVMEDPRWRLSLQTHKMLGLE